MELICQETGNTLTEALEFFLTALGSYPKGSAVIQADHAHEAGGVGGLEIVTQDDPEGLHRCKLDKILNFLKRANANIEFHDFYLPCFCTN